MSITHRNRITVSEAFESDENLTSKLNQKVVAYMNSKGGTDWSNASDSVWQNALDMCSSQKEKDALINSYFVLNKDKFGGDLNRLNDGQEVITKLVRELGFSESENPYISFIKNIYSNPFYKSVKLSNDDWTILNDLYADDTIDASDIRGTGRNRQKHIIYNPSLYSSGLTVDEKMYLIKLYEYLSEDANIKKLNLLAISKTQGLPYQILSGYTEEGKQGSGKTNNSDVLKIKGSGKLAGDKNPSDVRNILLYIDPKKPLGALHSVDDLKSAINIGQNNIYRGNREGQSKNNRVDSVKSGLVALSKDERVAIAQWLKDNGYI